MTSIRFGEMVVVRALFCGVMAIGACCCSSLVHGQSPIRLTDITAETGISFVHSSGASGLGYIVEAMSGGVATFDYDNDGLIDIYFTNGAPLKGSKEDPQSLRHALYRNLGNWKFQDVTEEAGLVFRGYGLGVVVGDYDNDGDQDLFLSNFGHNALFRNNGDRTFTNVTEQAGVLGKNEVGAGACFLDYDRDGYLDLFVASYVHFTYDNHVPVLSKGQYLMAGPQYYSKLPDVLYRNRGDGTFEDVSQLTGIGSVEGPGMGVVAGDFDDDGDTDIFVAQDGSPNLIYQNDGKGKFQEVGLLSGVASNYEGKIGGSMGVDGADYDGDGKLDFFVTNYQAEMPVLYRNLGAGLFEDATRKAQIPTTLYPHVNWGTAFIDFDLDGHRDIFIANGHFDRVELMDDRTSLKVPNFLLRNNGKGRFADVSKEAGSGMAIVESSRGAAFDDLDNDGDVDVVIQNSNAAPSLLRNDSVAKNHWIQFTLEGKDKNRDAVGTRIWVTAGGRTQMDEVHRGRGYQSHFGSRLTFGVGPSEKVDKIEIQWSDGQRQVLGTLQLDKHHKVVQEGN
ncbi:MAG: CRTAC1 family protein [Pirellulales bacterium]